MFMEPSQQHCVAGQQMCCWMKVATSTCMDLVFYCFTQCKVGVISSVFSSLNMTGSEILLRFSCIDR